ncbi:MAG: hypothetical protein FJ088_06320 [Deltaproteobacteria bacterium]|nr:hypothetical protein [Deltaproteobacteria bacterium]
MKFLRLLTLFSFSLLLFAHCGSSKQLKGGKPPEWSVRAPGGWKCTLGKETGFCGMGMVSGMKANASLRRGTAADKARAELVKFFDFYAATLKRAYAASTTEFTKEAAEQHVEEATKIFAKGSLSGVEMRDYWEDDEGTAFALAFLNFEDFKKAVDQIASLNAKAKEVIKQNAESAFEKLEAEEQKE